MLANYHSHTPRCNHATGSEREYIESAIANGFKILGFSDHTPQPYPSSYKSHIRMGMEELENYVDTLVKLREEYKDDITIYIGFEVEYFRKYFDALIKELRNYPVDYIIQGQHFIPDEIDGFYAGAPTYEDQHLIDYVDTAIEGMKTGMFTYLAHPDLIYYKGNDNTYKKHMERLIAASIDLNIPLEVNLLGFTGKRNYPCDKFFDLAAEMNANFVIGCDAHDPQSVCQPELNPEFMAFLNKHNITIGDNICALRSIK